MESLFANLDLKTVLTVLASALSAFAAIRADIKNIYARFGYVEKELERADKNAVEAHKRIDDHVMQLHVKGK
jgi:hypothetical protein